MRDLRIFRIFEGTNDILRLFVSLTGLQVSLNKKKRTHLHMLSINRGDMGKNIESSTGKRWLL